MNLRTILCVFAAGGISLAAPAAAVSFKLVDTGGTAVGTDARRGFEIAAGYWSSMLVDDVTVTIDIGFSSLGQGILGGAESNATVLFVDSVYDAMAGDSQSVLDGQAVDSLRPLTTVGGSGQTAGYAQLGFTANSVNHANTGYLDESTRLDNDGSINNIALSVNLANAAALGFSKDANGQPIDYTQSAGSIVFNNDYEFDFDPSDGVDAGSFDFIGVAIHEIGHVLGFISGVDSYDAYTYPGDWDNRTSGALEGYAINSVLDLFRYSDTGKLDLSTSESTKYFSIDGGTSQLFGDSRFAQGYYNGDGNQASHWKESPAGEPQDGILDPTAARGQTMEVTALDLAAYDAIGWNLNVDVLTIPGYRLSTAEIFAAAIPEPATWMQMLLGFGLLGGVLRRRDRGRIAAANA